MNPYILIGVFLAGFGSGGYGMNFYWTAKDNARIVAETEAREQAQQLENRIAQDVANLLQESKENVKTNTIYRTRYIDRPINSVHCTDNDGLQLIESYSTNNARKSVSKMPDETAKP